MDTSTGLDSRRGGREGRYGPWAVVTGASEGIGEAFARTLASRGLNVALAARRRDRLEALAAELEARHGVRTLVHAADLGSRAGRAGLSEATASLDAGLLVAAAGFGTSGPLADALLEDELAMVEVNCAAVLELAHVFGRRFVARGGGGLVLMSSLLAFQGVARAANYAATKAYVQTLAEGLRAELAPRGVDVVACAPGPVRSGFAARAGMTMGAAAAAADVPGPTLAALGRRGTVRPGLLSALLEASLTGQPRALRSLVLGRVVAGMTRASGGVHAGSAGENHMTRGDAS